MNQLPATKLARRNHQISNYDFLSLTIFVTFCHNETEVELNHMLFVWLLNRNKLNILFVVILCIIWLSRANVFDVKLVQVKMAQR